MGYACGPSGCAPFYADGSRVPPNFDQPVNTSDLPSFAETYKKQYNAESATSEAKPFSATVEDVDREKEST